MLDWLCISTWPRTDPFWSPINCYLCCFRVCKGMGCAYGIWCGAFVRHCSCVRETGPGWDWIWGASVETGLQKCSKLSVPSEAAEAQNLYGTEQVSDLSWLMKVTMNKGLCSYLLKPVCCLWRAFPKVLFFSLAAPKMFLPVTQMLSFCFMLSCYEADALVFFVPISSVSHWWNSIPLRKLWESSKMVEELSSSVALGLMTVMHCHWLLHALCM